MPAWDTMIGAIVVLRDELKPMGYVVQESGCWEWVGAMKSNGYGGLAVDGRKMQAHRYVYELYRGPIPAGLTLDHLCRNRRCVRPDHLEPVTFRTNVLRGVSAPAREAKQTHCLNGHPLTPENVWLIDGRRRQCRICSNARLIRHRAKKREQGAQ